MFISTRLDEISHNLFGWLPLILKEDARSSLENVERKQTWGGGGYYHSCRRKKTSNKKPFIMV